MSDTAIEIRLWYWQRISAMVLAICVLVHLAVIIYAVHGGLTGTEILARTRGNLAFGLFYATFVVACAVHVPIGLARILRESLGMREPAIRAVAGAFAVLLLVMGLRSVYGVVLA